MIKFYYITLDSLNVAEAISLALLEAKLAACANWFPINSAYRWEGGIEQAKEVVLIVKSVAQHFEAICHIVSEHIDYTNCIAELEPQRLNADYANWLTGEIL